MIAMNSLCPSRLRPTKQPAVAFLLGLFMPTYLKHNSSIHAIAI